MSIFRSEFGVCLAGREWLARRRGFAAFCVAAVLGLSVSLAAQQPATDPGQAAATPQQPATAAPAANPGDAAQQPAAPAPDATKAPAAGDAPSAAPTAPAPAATAGDAAQQPPAPAPAETKAPATGDAAPAVPAAPAPVPASSDATPPAPAADQTAPAAQATPAAPATDAATPADAESTDATPSTAGKSPTPAEPKGSGITEDQLKQLLVGKELYLRGGYLDNSLEFGENGQIIGHSAQGSYTLCGIQIEKVHLTKHKVELEGARYGLHFLGALPYEDPTKAVDRVRITPKKKIVKITIDRELVITPKKVKEAKVKGKAAAAKPGSPPAAAPSTATNSTPAAGAAPATQNASAAPVAAAATPVPDAAATPVATAPVAASETTAANAPPAAPPATTPAPDASAPAAAAPATPSAATTQPAPPSAPAAATAAAPAKELTDAEQAKAEMAAAPAAERPADPNSVTTTTSPAHAAKVLRDALDKIFAPGLDDRMMAAMPDFWKLYYQAAAAKTDYRPKDASILRQGMVDQKATIIGKFEPQSNEFAQGSGIAGPALYHAVIGADGKATEVAVARPIGFGLDESAVDAIKKASFQPAIKDGKPVAVMLDLYVPFRIYSKRTDVAAKQEEEKPSGPLLPGPYTLQEQKQQQEQSK